MPSPNVRLVIPPAPHSRPQRATHTRVDTIQITPEIVRAWQNPPFQRPLRANDKVLSLSETMARDGGVVPGVITLGVLDKTTYLLDGQHRREAFLISGCTEGYCDARWHFFEDMADMGEEFVSLNTQLVRLRPDDVLRGLEASNDGMMRIREKCAFVGYDQIRRNDRSPIVSMSTLLRCWFGSAPEVPTSSGAPAMKLARSLTIEDADQIVDFLKLIDGAWGRDQAYMRLWSALNFTICAWLYRRLVITQYSPATPKLSKDMFKKCLMSLSANPDYLDWLVGRNISERDRSPAYSRIKKAFATRIGVETGKKPRLPQPAWERGHMK
jgi:hypothetical protein